MEEEQLRSAEAVQELRYRSRSDGREPRRWTPCEYLGLLPLPRVIPAVARPGPIG